MREYRSLVSEIVSDPDEAAEYLRQSLEAYEEDGNLDAFLPALKTVAAAQGGISQLPTRTGLNRQSLYRTLSPQGNPRLKTLHTILNTLGYKLSIQPLG